ncbi:MAG: GNAT family N-acetyltransferase [Gammaproteobacteria bacterium]
MTAYSDNSFPPVLNLVQAALEVAFGETKSVCYGIGSDTDSIPAMQSQLLSRIAEAVLAHSDQGDRILLVGPSVTTLHAGLAQSGMEVETVSGESERLEKPVSAVSIALEKLQRDPASFESIVVEGSVGFKEQLAVLTMVRKSLGNDGHLILFGENLRDDSEIKRSPLANLSSLTQLSERLGFAVENHDDYTAEAARCLDKFIELVASNRDRLLEMPDFNDSILQALQSELKQMADEFANGRRCFGLFTLRKLENPPGEYAQAEYGDIHSFSPTEVREMFEASFGVEFDPELWRWKYELGSGTCVVAREHPGGAIVSHYGGAPRKIDYFGKPSMAIQPCDVMVLPEVRRHYGKSSLFFKTAATFLEREIGNTVDHLLGFGFPNQKAMNIALRLGLYEKTDDFVELVYPPPAEDSMDAERSQAYEFVPVDIEDEQHRAQIDRLWQEMRVAHESGIVGVRDADYVRYRYFDHPFQKRGLYQCLFVQSTSNAEVLALVVLKEHAQQLLLMDMVCAAESIGSTLDALNLYCHSQAESRQLKTWITQGWQTAVERPGCTVNELGIEIPCNSWNPGPSSEVLYGAWWLMAGDMDFV